MSKTKISWTEKVWNPITGCTKIAQGCKNCYAESIAKRFWGDRKFTDIHLHPERLEQPLRWKKPSMIFVNSMSDLFHEKVPFEFVEKVFKVMQSCKRHTFQILTKRPERMKGFINNFYNTKDYIGNPNENIWLGTSISTQADADKNIPILLNIPAKVRWLSVEPLLEEIYDPFSISELEWVVIGCESGSNRRPCNVKWVESIVWQCKDAGVPVFVKQLNINGKVVKDINLFPKHLQIREYPKQ